MDLLDLDPDKLRAAVMLNYCAQRSATSAMISCSRSAPTAAASSIKRTTSANRTVTCLYSALVSTSLTGGPQPWQNRGLLNTLTNARRSRKELDELVHRQHHL